MSDDVRADSPGLPEWFERPRPTDAQQRTLFQIPLAEVLAGLRVSTDDLNRWHRQGWVSFSVERQELEQWDMDEIQLVRDVVRSGLSDAQIECLFEQLPKPMRFDVSRLAWSFQSGWVVIPPRSEPDPDEIIDEHLEDWLDNLDVDSNCGRLVDLRERINTLLASAGNSESQSSNNERRTT